MLTQALLLLAAFSLVLSLCTHACVRILLRRRLPPAAELPPVSVLKPLKGIDDGLYRNLASFAELDYPRLQLVLGAADPHDPALVVARRVQRAYPHVDIRIVAGAAAIGRNPKVSNLAALAREAKHEVWLISDSNVRARPSYLRETVAELARPGVGLVTNLFAGVAESSTGALLENQQLSTWVPGGIAAAQVVTGRACVVGKSMLFHRSVLDGLGGWAAFADILAEDYVIGCRVAELGLRATTSPHVVCTVNASWPLARFMNRHLRWAQIRRRLCPAAYLAEPLLNPVLWCVLLAVAGAPLPALALVAAKVASDAALARRLRGTGFGWAALLAIPVKDLLLAGVWVVGGFRRRVQWRGHALWIGAGSELSDAPRGREHERRLARGRHIPAAGTAHA